MLHDSILFSPGVDDGCASRILDKLKRCASKYFGSWFEYVKYRETFKRCQCERLFQYLMEIGKAIKKMRKISFRYRKNGKLSDRVYTVTPYFLVISGGWYYLICNTDGKDNLSHYRIDRMLQVVMHPMEHGKCMSQLEGIDSSFEILQYMEEHPRMSYEKPVSATLMVEEYLVEAVEMEFRITSKIKTQEHLFRMESEEEAKRNLRAGEIPVMHKYRKLDESDQCRVQGYMDALLEKQDGEKRTS